MTDGFGGYMDKLLRVNLSQNRLNEEKLPTDMRDRFLGGRGIGAKILYDEVGPEVKPLTRENKIIIMTGPLTGTKTPGSHLHIIQTLSPLTGIYLNTVAMGRFGWMLKHAGYDGLIIEGKAEDPSFISVTPDGVEIRDARFVWGMATDNTQEFVKEAISEPRAIVACIGPAGERLVPYSGVISERRMAGRGGAGTVFGSKNLKAIAVYGETEVPISDPEAYSAALKEHYKGFNSPYGTQHREYGSSKTIYGVQEFGLLPTRNWQTGIFDAVEALYPENWIPKYRVHKHGCPYCPIPCGHITLVRDGPYAGEMSEGPEYETLFSFGSMLGISNMDAVIAANGLSDRLGIDQIEAGAAIAFAMECYQRGILTKNETDGLELTWGNHEALITLMKKIANREGLGDLLSKGVRVMAEEIGRGTERFAMQAKGLALGGYDPRAVKGQGISMAQAPRGGCHHNAARSVLWETKHPYNPLDNEGKPELIRKLILLRMYVDLAPMCAFYQPITNLDTVSKLLTSVTGNKFDEQKILKTDERVYNLERAFNVRLGVTRHHDTLPERLLKDPMPEGPAKGHVWEGRILMDGFYEVSGWDKKTGIPTRKKLIDLELKDIAEDLEKKGINLADE